MKMFSLMVAAVLALGIGFGSGNAEAKRLGGAKSFGMQRQMDAPKPATPPAAAPTAPAATGSAAAAAPAAAAQAAKPRPSWMGPVAGLAAGLGLAALASHFGFGEELASMLMIGLLVMAVVVVVGLIMRKRATAQQPALASAGAMRYQAQEPVAANRGYDVSMPASGGSSGASSSAANIPADFDVAGFVRNAKVHFIRLQAANDAGNLDDIREFTTPEMFAELKMNFAERGDAAQETDVVGVEADVIDVIEEATRYIVSVRFTGQIREEKNGPVESFDEVWHLVKPRSGTGGWLLAGIQQFQ
ncbi:MAG: Tim44-like domain-containing protein [Pseudomonadota bacterium]